MSLDLKLCQKQWRQTWEHFGFKVGAIACWLMLLVNASSSLLKNTISDIYLFNQIGLNGVATIDNIWWPTWRITFTLFAPFNDMCKQQKYLLIIQCCMLGFILHIDEYISIWLTFELSDIVAGLTCEFSCEAGKVVLQSPPCFFFFTFNLKHWCGGQSGETLHNKFNQAACWSKHN